MSDFVVSSGVSHCTELCEHRGFVLSCVANIVLLQTVRRYQAFWSEL